MTHWSFFLTSIFALCCINLLAWIRLNSIVPILNSCLNFYWSCSVQEQLIPSRCIRLFAMNIWWYYFLLLSIYLRLSRFIDLHSLTLIITVKYLYIWIGCKFVISRIDILIEFNMIRKRHLLSIIEVLILIFKIEYLCNDFLMLLLIRSLFIDCLNL